MGSRRHLTIGITVNLDNYENLRLEMSGEVEEGKDTEDLIASLEAVLARLGRGTPETAERVDSYRHRVFTQPKEAIRPENVVEDTPPGAVTPFIPPPPPVEVPAPPPSPVQATFPVPPVAPPKPVKSPAPAIVQVPEKPVVPASGPVTPTGTPPVPSRQPSPPPLPSATRTDVPAPSPVAARQTEAPPPSPALAPPPTSPGDIRCEQCGAPMTTVQRKLSRLFQNKDLCKKCLNKP